MNHFKKKRTISFFATKTLDRFIKKITVSLPFHTPLKRFQPTNDKKSTEPFHKKQNMYKKKNFFHPHIHHANTTSYKVTPLIPAMLRDSLTKPPKHTNPNLQLSTIDYQLLTNPLTSHNLLLCNLFVRSSLRSLHK